MTEAEKEYYEMLIKSLVAKHGHGRARLIVSHGNHPRDVEKFLHDTIDGLEKHSTNAMCVEADIDDFGF